MIRFRAQRPLFLLVLADSRKAMKWLRDDGFQDLVGHAIARRVLRGTLQEVYFTIHGKYFPTDSYVELRGNYSKDITTMYTVFAVPAPDMEDPQSVQNQVSTSSMLSQIHFHQTYDRSLPNRCWLDGGEGLALFYTGKFCLFRLSKGTACAANITVFQPVSLTSPRLLFIHTS